jgi:hypothetical protein
MNAVCCRASARHKKYRAALAADKTGRGIAAIACTRTHVAADGAGRSCIGSPAYAAKRFHYTGCTGSASTTCARRTSLIGDVAAVSSYRADIAKAARASGDRCIPTVSACTSRHTIGALPGVTGEAAAVSRAAATVYAAVPSEGDNSAAVACNLSG